MSTTTKKIQVRWESLLNETIIYSVPIWIQFSAACDFYKMFCWIQWLISKSL